MPILKFHVAGQWSLSQFRSQRIDSTWRANPEIWDLIEAAWAQANRQPGVSLFDGPMCRLESWQAANQQLTLTLSDTSYKKFLGTNLAHPDLADRFGREVLANPVGVSPALLTADGFLMMGRRNASVAYYPQRIHPFAGALDPQDASPFAAIERELAEELAFAPGDLESLHCTGIAEDLAIRQPELIFYAQSRRTRFEIESRLDKTEHHGTWACTGTAAGVAAALRSDEQFTPVAIASLLLYARVNFGEKYYEEMGQGIVGP